MSQSVFSFSRFQSSGVFFVLGVRLCGRALKWSVCALSVNDSSVVAVVRAFVFLSSASFVGPPNSSGRFVSQCFRFCFFCDRLFVHLLARVLFRSFLRFFARLFFRDFGQDCTGLGFLCRVVVSVHLRCAMCVVAICL